MSKHLIKLTILSILCLFNISAIAANNPFELTVSTFSLNRTLTSLTDIDFGYKLELKYAINRNFYVKGNVRTYKQQKWGVGFKVGYQYPYRKITPYAEIGFDEKPVPQGLRPFFAYDVGLKYKLARHFQPFIEFDNFTIPAESSTKIGTAIPLNNRLASSGDYIHSLASDGNGFELKFSMKF